MSQTSVKNEVNPIVTTDEIRAARDVVDSIYVDDSVKDYILSLVFATREPKEYGVDIDNLIQFGASPRATIALTLAAKAWAFLQGRGYVIPEDVKTLAPDVLRHRILLEFERQKPKVSADDDVVAKDLSNSSHPVKAKELSAD